MNDEIKSLVLNALFGFIVCILLGLLFFGVSIFNFHVPIGIIVISGFYGAIFYSVIKYRNSKEQIFIAFALFILDFIIQGRAITMTFLIRDVLLMLSLFFSLYSYKLFINKYISFPLFLRSFALPLFFGFFNILATIILIIIFNPSAMNINYALFHNARYAAFVGIGLGLGFDLFEKNKNKFILKEKVNVV
jgi:hypothetical protein